MDPHQTTAPPPPPYIPPSTSPGVFGSKIPSVVAFAIGILLFLLPFAEIKCSGSSLANKSGLDIAMGNEWKPAPGSLLDQKDLKKQTTTGNDKEDKGNTQIYAIAALGLAV